MEMSQYASIATNDPDNDPTPRIALQRFREGEVYVWRDNHGDMVAIGETIAAAEKSLRFVFSFPAWDLRFHNKLPVPVSRETMDWGD